MKRTLGAIALLAAFAAPTLAHAAASAIATTDVNMRAGPSTAYPVVTVIGGGNNLTVYGCLEGGAWCDVNYRGARGWMSGNYLAYLERGPRYTAPVVTFSFGSYWDDHYRGYGFYRDRDRYRHWRHDRYDDRWDRRERRWDRRDDRRDWRDERREVRQERRDVRNARQELREARRNGENTRYERRQLREERRELRDARRDLRDERRY